jgi:adhesin transport system outer membrane protein
LFAVLLLAGCLCASAILGGTVHAQTLEEAVRQALSSFPELRSAAANRRALLEAAEVARAQRLPSIDALFGQGRERSENAITRSIIGGPRPLTRSEAELTVSQLLFDGGGASSQIRRQGSLAASAAEQVAATSESVAFRVAQAYLELLRLREMLNISRANVAAHQRTLEQVNVRVEAGADRRADSRQAEARLALAQSSIAQLRGQLESAETTYRHLTGRPAGISLVSPRLSPAALAASAREAVEQALASHPSIRSAQLEVEAAAADLELARSRMNPRVTLELGLTHDRDISGIRGLNADQSAMLRLRQNLFRGGADAAREREGEARRDEAQAQLGRARNDVERDVRQAWESLVAERERLPQSRSYANAAVEVVEAYRAQFRIGQRSLLDVLNAENEASSARANEVSGESALSAAGYRLLSTQGLLLSTLAITLPEVRPQ